MKIYFAGEGAGHDYVNNHRVGMRKRLFNYKDKSRFKRYLVKMGLKKTGVKGTPGDEG